MSTTRIRHLLACSLASLLLSAAAGCAADGEDGDPLVSATLTTQADDATAVCGNGIVEAGEECDVGDINPGDGCDANCKFEAIALRLNKMEIRDPHIFSDILFCTDITGIANALLDESLNQDKSTPPDGALDISVLPVFRPLAPAAATTELKLDPDASCTVPAASTSCTSTGAQVVESVATNQATGTCLEAVPGTTFSGYTPAIATPAAPCFSSDGETLDVSLGSVVIRLTDARIAGTYVGNPVTGVTSGLMRGFISVEQARTTIFPANLPLVGGKNLAQLLAGGDTFCTRPGGGKDLDFGPDGVTPGWWFYLNYSAAPVPYTIVTPPPPATP